MRRHLPACWRCSQGIHRNVAFGRRGRRLAPRVLCIGARELRRRAGFQRRRRRNSGSRNSASRSLGRWPNRRRLAVVDRPRWCLVMRKCGGRIGLAAVRFLRIVRSFLAGDWGAIGVAAGGLFIPPARHQQCTRASHHEEDDCPFHGHTCCRRHASKSLLAGVEKARLPLIIGCAVGPGTQIRCYARPASPVAPCGRPHLEWALRICAAGSEILLISRHGEFVAAIVFRMTAMARDAGISQLVLRNQFIEPPP